MGDGLAFELVFGAFVLVVHGGRETLAPLPLQSAISLDPSILPEYALRTTMRMLAAIIASLGFTFIYGALAAKSWQAEMAPIPLLDILQSVPVLAALATLIGSRSALDRAPAPCRRTGSAFRAVLAAFPANIVFPFAVAAIVGLRLNPDIWLSPLMVLGTQWYVLFNVIAGASAFPNDLREAAGSFRIRGWRWWAEVILPGIFPYYVTGAITASGGSCNASSHLPKIAVA